MDTSTGPERGIVQTYNPWTIVNLVFSHLAEQGLHPVLGDRGDPGAPAAALLQAMGIAPSPAGNARMKQDMRDQLADLRKRLMENET